jgi:hypothetical protein
MQERRLRSLRFGVELLRLRLRMTPVHWIASRFTVFSQKLSGRWTCYLSKSLCVCGEGCYDERGWPGRGGMENGG